MYLNGLSHHAATWDDIFGLFRIILGVEVKILVNFNHFRAEQVSLFSPSFNIS